MGLALRLGVRLLLGLGLGLGVGLLGREVTKPNKLFKEIYARVYTDHYQEIIEQIETYGLG